MPFLDESAPRGKFLSIRGTFRTHAGGTNRTQRIFYLHVTMNLNQMTPFMHTAVVLVTVAPCNKQIKEHPPYYERFKKRIHHQALCRSGIHGAHLPVNACLDIQHGGHHIQKCGCHRYRMQEGDGDAFSWNGYWAPGYNKKIRVCVSSVCECPRPVLLRPDWLCVRKRNQTKKDITFPCISMSFCLKGHVATSPQIVEQHGAFRV